LKDIQVGIDCEDRAAGQECEYPENLEAVHAGVNEGIGKQNRASLGFGKRDQRGMIVAT